MVNVLTCTIGGSIVGMIPLGLLMFPTFPTGTNALVQGISTVIDGVTTSAGWLQYGQFLLVLGSYGAFSGFAFWLFLKFVGGPMKAAEQ